MNHDDLSCDRHQLRCFLYKDLLQRFDFWPSLLFDDFIRKQVNALTTKMKNMKNSDSDDDELETMLKFIRKIKSPLSFSK
jgi:hypothetical protein